MASMECANVPNQTDYSCANPWGVDCTRAAGFDFLSLWTITQNIYNSCATDARLFQPDHVPTDFHDAALTQAACVAIAGPDYTVYSGGDIWTRLTTWKLPLLQLAASFPRPPLSLKVETFVIIHLLGDPVDTIRNLLCMLSKCQKRALYWKAQFSRNGALVALVGQDSDFEWKALALITTAYDEWNRADRATKILQQSFHDLVQDAVNGPEAERQATFVQIRKVLKDTGDALAADRTTKFLPITVAVFIFIGTVAIAFGKTAASAASPSTYVNVEAHSIAFTALYFWIIPASFLGAIIGVSQTEGAIPRILTRFQRDLNRHFQDRFVLPNECLKEKDERVINGGIYSWRPSNWHADSAVVRQHSIGNRGPLVEHIENAHQDDDVLIHRNEFLSTVSSLVLPFIALFVGGLTGMLVSYLVPPKGFDCRHECQIAIILAWVVSLFVDVLVEYWVPLTPAKYGRRLKFTIIKDCIAIALTFSLVIATQVGILNKCECFTNWGKTGLALPEMPSAAADLGHRIRTVYPGLIFGCLVFEFLAFPLYVAVRYPHAFQVFLQRDDGKSDFVWIRRVHSFFRPYFKWWATFRGYLPGRTIAVEQGIYSQRPSGSRRVTPIDRPYTRLPGRENRLNGTANGHLEWDDIPMDDVVEPISPIQSNRVDSGLTRRGTHPLPQDSFEASDPIGHDATMAGSSSSVQNRAPGSNQNPS